MKKAFYLFLCLFLIVVTPCLSPADEPPQAPLLRLEADMHTAVIKRIGIDAANRFLVTSSNDKTVRLWEIPSGRLLHVFRPPIGEGNEGKLYAVAISPDGNTVACAGWTGQNWGEGFYIYLFDRETGALKKRITNLSATIMNMTYSKDGRFLVACLWNKYGIQVFRTSDYTPVGRDSNYASDSYGAEFSNDGRLVTVSYDGNIRLYDRNFRLAAKVKATSGNRPYHVSFTPDGSKIAVGFDDSSRVDVYDGYNLSYLFSPNTSGIAKNMMCVSWSADGQSLYAGGMYAQGRTRMIARWDYAGRGAPVYLPAAFNTILHILPLNRGGIVYATYDPTFGVYNAQNRRILFKAADIADYRDNRKGFLVSYDGATVQFGYEQWGKSPARFSILDRRLEMNPPENREMSPPLVDNTGIDVTGWQYTTQPRINGVPVKLDAYERALSLAVSPDRTKVLLGADWSLCLYDQSGNELWHITVPEAPWGVNISGNGRVAVAAFGDGTIRWYRMTDGRELLAFFPHNDRKRWVIWTPSGYYDNSEGGDELIGWHVNNGRDRTASFYPVSRFFEQFYRPEIIVNVIKTLETDTVLVARLGKKEQVNLQAGMKKPPHVTIASPRMNEHLEQEDIEVKVVAQDQGGGIDEIRLYHNGKVVPEDTRGIKITTKGAIREKTYLVQLLDGSNRLTATAFSKDRIESNPANISVSLKGVTQYSNLYVLVVGINQYKNSSLNLNYAEPDALGIKNFFMSPTIKKLFKNVYATTLMNREATGQNIKNSFNTIKGKAKLQDTVIIYLAGHGDTVGEEWFFIPHDIVTPEVEEDLKQGGLSAKQITDTVKGFRSQKVSVMLDSCKSGGMVMAMRGFEERKALIQLARSTGTYIISASTDKQLAAEVRSLGHGVFTYTLLEGLQGKAGDKNRKVTVESLIQYVKNRLPELTEIHRGAPQYPISWGAGMDFPLILY